VPNRDLPVRRIALAAAALGMTVVAVALATSWLAKDDGRSANDQPAWRSSDLVIAGPRLQSAPQPELAAYRAEKDRQLHGIGWVDRARGIAHIPIDDAMALLVTRAASAPASGQPASGAAR
jgi:hypothetical protein